MDETITIESAVRKYLQTVKFARSENTFVTYSNAMSFYCSVLTEHNIIPAEINLSLLNEESIAWAASALKVYAATTEKLYLTAINGFFEYLAAEQLLEVNLPRIRLLIRQRGRKPGIRLPQFPEGSIEQIIRVLEHSEIDSKFDEIEQLRFLRDRSFLITLADTGMRVHEACNLRRGDIDWLEGHAIIIGKGNQQALVRFSQRSLFFLKKYLEERSKLDGSSNRPLSSLPLFSRHDKGAGKKIQRITTTTGRNIVTQYVRDILGPDAVGTITPHSFRHYFVTKILKGSGNLKLAQELARHKNITVTQRYAHLADDELDRGYHKIFEEDRKE